MTAPRSVKVGAVELKYNGAGVTPTFSHKGIWLHQGSGGRWIASYSYGCEVVALEAAKDIDEAAALLTARLAQLRAALADVLGEEEGTK